jgi:hypothetical protein
LSNLIKNGALLLAQLLKEHASETVTYTRGTSAVDVPATFGAKLLKTQDEFGQIRLEHTDLDFIIPADDLVFEDVDFIEPMRGDIVIVTQGNIVQHYQVMPFGSDPPWRWSDPFRINYRIHTKLIREEPIPYA